MPRTVCTVSDLPAGHLALTRIASGQTGLVFPVRTPETTWLLMLPGLIPRPDTDFRLRLLVSSNPKVVDLGSDFFFDYDLDEVLMSEQQFAQDAGSLLLNGSNVAIWSAFSKMPGQFDDYLPSAVNVRTGDYATMDYQTACEVKSWRLYLASDMPNTPPTLVSRREPAPGQASA